MNGVPPAMNTNGFYTANMRWQNTGTVNWPSTRLAYQWRNTEGVIVGSGVGPSSSFLTKGSSSLLFINAIQVFAPATPGVYTLIIDMQVNNGGSYQFFFNREPGRPWYPLIYTCQVGGGGCTLGGEIISGNVFLPVVLKNF
jgi:hypothetical protein